MGNIFITEKEAIEYIRTIINENTEIKLEDTAELAIAIECYSQILLELEEQSHEV